MAGSMAGIPDDVWRMASELLDQIAQAPTPGKKADLTEMLMPALVGLNGVAHCAADKIPEMVQRLGEVLTPLLDAALQQPDWRQPSHLPGLDACSMLLHCISRHLHKCYQTPWASSLTSSLQASGLLAALPKAMDKAREVLVAPDSAGPVDMSFTQYLSRLMLVWSDVLRKIPNYCLWLKDGDALAPLLLPGADLAWTTLRLYAGPEGALFRATNTRMPGHDPFMLLTLDIPKDKPVTRQLLQQLMQEQGGRMVCDSAIANALRVADSFALMAFNANKDCFGLPGTVRDHLRRRSGKETLAGQVLADDSVTKLVAALLFALVKQLHIKQAGKAGAAVPRTASSGRAKQKDMPSSPADVVPPHHDLIGAALGLDLLLTDEAVFSDVMGWRAPGAPPTPGLTTHVLDSTIIDPLQGLVNIVMDSTGGTARGAELAMQGIVLSNINMRLTGHLSDKLSQAMLMTSTELCLLQPSEHGEDALRLAAVTMGGLVSSFIAFAGAGAFFRSLSAKAGWVDDCTPLQHPDLQDLVEPVLREVVTLLVPLLLPECFDIPLPSAAAADPCGSKLSALLPQHVLTTASAVHPSLLAELFQEQPLSTTRALESGLRMYWAERPVVFMVRCQLLSTLRGTLIKLALPGDSAAAAPNKLTAALVAPNGRQLLLQLQALLVSLVKYAAGFNAEALAAAAAAAKQPARSVRAAGSSSGSNGGTSSGSSGGSSSGIFSSATADAMRSALAWAKTQAQQQPLRQMPRAASGSTSSTLTPEVQGMINGLAGQFEQARSGVSSAGQFRDTLQVLGDAAAAAALLGSVAVNAAAAEAGAAAATSSSSSSSSSGSENSRAQLTAPFLSVIGRSLHLTGASLAAASQQAAGMEAIEFDSCCSTLVALLASLNWVAAEPACLEVMASTGAADADAVDRLRSSLQAQLWQGAEGQGGSASGPVLQGRAVADRVCESGLAEQLQAVGGAMCGVSPGACGNAGCKALGELSEIALVTPSKARKQHVGGGKCAACNATSFCSRTCQKVHWRNGHKAFCKAHTAATGASVAASPAAALPTA